MKNQLKIENQKDELVYGGATLPWDLEEAEVMIQLNIDI